MLHHCELRAGLRDCVQNSEPFDRSRRRAEGSFEPALQLL
jgi:hypothetical protein